MSLEDTMNSLSERYADFKDDTAAFMERNPALQATLRGTAFGAGAYATVALVKEVLDAIEDKKKQKKRKKPKISDDTLVITTPKLASARDFIKEFDNQNCGKASLRQARNSDGTFASGFDVVCEDDKEDVMSKLDKEAQASEKEYRDQYDPTFLENAGDTALGMFGGIAGVGLGWFLTQKTYDYLKRKRLEREIAAAQKEYIDFLQKQSSVKEAATEYVGSYDNIRPVVHPSAFESMVLSSDTTEEPEDNVGGFGSNMLGIAGGTALLLAAASSYLTKKFLDKKFEEGEDDSNIVDRARVKNIVFKTASAEIPVDAVDIVGGMEFMAMIMQAKPNMNEKTAAGFDINAFLDDNAGPDAKPAAADFILSQVLNRGGINTDDPTQSTYGQPGYTENPLDDTSASVLSLFTDKDKGWQEPLFNAFMSEKYRPVREYLARNRVTNWYKGTGFGDTWLGQFIQPAVDWIFGGLSNVMANTEWGKRIMADKMRQEMQRKLDDYNTRGRNGNQGEGYATPGATPGSDGTFVDPTTGKAYRIGGDTGPEPVDQESPPAAPAQAPAEPEPAPAQNEPPAPAEPEPAPAAPAPAPAEPEPAPAEPEPAPAPAPPAPAPAPAPATPAPAAAARRRYPNSWANTDFEFTEGAQIPLTVGGRAVFRAASTKKDPVPEGMSRILVPGTGKPLVTPDGWELQPNPDFPARFVNVPNAVIDAEIEGQ